MHDGARHEAEHFVTGWTAVVAREAPNRHAVHVVLELAGSNEPVIAENGLLVEFVVVSANVVDHPDQAHVDLICFFGPWVGKRILFDDQRSGTADYEIN